MPDPEQNWHPAHGDEACMDCHEPLDRYTRYPTDDPDIVELLCLSCALLRSLGDETRHA